MNFFRNNPFTRILIFWLTGIFLSKYLPQSVYILIPVALALLFYSIFLSKRKKYPFDFASSIFSGSTICLLAFGFSSIKTQKILPEKQTGFYKLVLLEQPVEKTNSIQLNVQILQADTSALVRKKAVIYTEKSFVNEKLNAGSLLFCKATLHKIKNRGNPFEFDYSTYMARQSYYYTAFINAADIEILPDSKKSLIYLAENFRFKLLQILKSNIKSGEAFQVISALSLGYRKELSPEIKSRFAATGAMHVLAVSGLHVGMIYLFLSQLLYFLKRKKTGRWFYVIIIAAVLWFYALLTGFSPSVQRATIMFSFILVGNSLKRPSSIYNSLAASAFLLLLINTDLLYEVGFQLSYLAVLSIVFFYPRLEKLFTSNYWLIKKSWQLVCVSLAAQIGTFALSIYYFNQFPVYFWLSNFIVIPAAYLILGLSFTFLLLSPIHLISAIVASLLEGIAQITIYMLSIIEQLPSSLIKGFSIYTSQLLCLVLMLFSIIFFIKWKRKTYLFIGLSLLVLFQIDGLNTKQKLFNQQKVIVYNSQTPVLHLINGRRNYLLHFEEENPSEYLHKNPVCKLQLERPILININKMDSLKNEDLFFDKGTIQFITQSFHLQNGKRTIQPSNLFYSYTKVIVKGSMNSPTIFILEKDKKNVKEPRKHSLLKCGAFVADL